MIISLLITAVIGVVVYYVVNVDIKANHYD